MAASPKTRYPRRRLRTLRRLLGADQYVEERPQFAAELQDFAKLAAQNAFPSLSQSELHRDLTAGRYLEICRVCYAADMPLLDTRPAANLYRSFADGRHGGLLFLPPNDPVAFREWIVSPDWDGCHPWEMLRGRIRLMMALEPWGEECGRYRLILSPQSLRDHTPITYALALRRAGIAFEMREHDVSELARWARGDTWVHIVPDALYQNGEALHKATRSLEDWIPASLVP